MLKIPLAPVQSSVLSGIGYDPSRKILALQFAETGDIRHYGDVAAETCARLLTAPSKGRFFTQHIKGKYPVQLMTGTCPTCGAMGYIGDRCEDCGCADVVGPPREDARGE